MSTVSLRVGCPACGGRLRRAVREQVFPPFLCCDCGARLPVAADEAAPSRRRREAAGPVRLEERAPGGSGACRRPRSLRAFRPHQFRSG